MFGRKDTYERALKAGRTGAGGDAGSMATAIEMIAAQWALDAGTVAPGSPYAFSPGDVWSAAQEAQLDTWQVVDLLNTYGMNGVTSLLGA